MMERDSLSNLQARENAALTSYAMRSDQSLGRVYPEPLDTTRLPFQHDRDRIIHSKAFRRLQGKTQVFAAMSRDHYRNRLIHSLEVAHIARDLARTLRLNEDLAETLALAHDLGHPPFGHGGEAALNEVMQEQGLSFEHNEQSRRIVQKLEIAYPDFPGLNLTKEVLDGLLKHSPHNYETYTHFKISCHLEGQLVDLSDEIAYINHDIEDGVRSKILTLDLLRKYDLWNMAEEKYLSQTTLQDQTSEFLYEHRIVSTLMSIMISDLCEETKRRIKENQINSLEDVRECPVQLVGFSHQIQGKLTLFRQFLLEKFYFHPEVNQEIIEGKTIIKKLFHLYLKHTHKLPEPYIQAISLGEKPENVVKDYIAGMTDHYAHEKYQTNFTDL